MHASQPITLVVTRFEDLLAGGLRAVLEGDVNLEIVARDVQHDRVEAVLRGHRPRVAVLDVDALANLAEVRQLSRHHPHTSLVLLATHPTTTECAQLLAFGASACLSKGAQARDVLNAVHLAARGLQLTPRGHQAPVRRSAPGSQLLTQREADVLPLLQQGSSNAQIALALHVGVETVRTHARSIYRKLGVSSRRELSAQPPRASLITPDGPIAAQPWRRVNPEGRRQRRPGSFRR